MSDRPSKPANLPRLIPHLTVSDIEAAMAFYERAFGFERIEESITYDGDGRIRHAEMAFEEALIMLGPQGLFGFDTKTPKTLEEDSPVSLYVYCDDVDALHERATEQGAEAKFGPEEMFWGDRMCTLIDPDGHRWNFVTNVSEFDATKMPDDTFVVPAVDD